MVCFSISLLKYNHDFAGSSFTAARLECSIRVLTDHHCSRPFSRTKAQCPYLEFLALCHHPEIDSKRRYIRFTVIIKVNPMYEYIIIPWSSPVVAHLTENPCKAAHQIKAWVLFTRSSRASCTPVAERRAPKPVWQLVTCPCLTPKTKSIL